jgi:hypothetical protein
MPEEEILAYLLDADGAMDVQRPAIRLHGHPQLSLTCGVALRCSCRVGVLSPTEHPSINRSSQNRVLWPLPTVMVAEAKNVCSLFLNHRTSLLHARLSSTWPSQSQSVGTMRLVRSKSWTPSLPTGY